MKKIIAFFLCIVLLGSSTVFDIAAADENEVVPKVISFSLTSDFNTVEVNGTDNSRASGLITSYDLWLDTDGRNLKVYGQTYGTQDVVKCGFKDLVIQRRASSSESWKDYFEFGNVYVDMTFANLSTTVYVAAGYQYRISCKHYAKKSLLVTQSISNTSNIVTVS